MKKTERSEHEIMEYLKVAKSITLAQAQDLLHASVSTVRRAFIRLEERGQVLRRYGGVVLNTENDNYDYSYDAVETRLVEQKRRIGRAAVAYVTDGDMLYLDSGTTIAHFARALAESISEGKLRNITVFTNSLVNLNVLAECCRVNLIGGEYRAARRDFCGYIAEEAVKQLHFTRCFLGADGYSPQRGFTATDFYTARLNELALAASDERIILADSSKLSLSSVIGFSRQSPIDRLITEQAPEASVAARFAQEGTQIILSE